MDWMQATLLGVVEGLTEYLPVSSTGHLVLAQRAMGIGQGEAADAYAICIQLGAIVAVLGLYAGRVRQMAAGVAGRDPAGLRLATAVAAAFLPAAAAGLLLEKHLKEYLFNLPSIAAAWLVGGLALVGVSRWLRARGRVGLGLEEVTAPTALLIGLAQCAALWPGTSRSLAVIVGGLLAGLSLDAAVEFSFLLGLVTLGAATAHDLLKHGRALAAAYPVGVMAVGFLAAALAAAVSVSWLVSYLRRRDLAIFGWYRVALSLAVALLLVSGSLSG